MPPGVLTAQSVAQYAVQTAATSGGQKQNGRHTTLLNFLFVFRKRNIIVCRILGLHIFVWYLLNVVNYDFIFLFGVFLVFFCLFVFLVIDYEALSSNKRVDLAGDGVPTTNDANCSR